MKNEMRPVLLMPGDETPFGVVSHVTATRRNTVVTVHFTDGTLKTFTYNEKIQVLAAGGTND